MRSLMLRREGGADVGYGDSLEWRYKNRHLSEAIVRFEDHGHRVRAVEVVNAAKRLFLHSPPNSVENAIANVRVLLRAIPEDADDMSMSEWDAALITALQKRQTSASSRHSRYKVGSLILRELARARGETVTFRNPFRKDSEPIPLADPEAVRKALNLARRDVGFYWTRFTADSSSEDWPIIERTRDFARKNGGPLPQFDRKTELSREFAAWLDGVNRERPERVGRRTLEPYCYATTNALLAIIFLIVHRLAGNVDSVVSLTRDCLHEIPDPIYGSRFILTMEKRRANRDLQYRLLDTGRFSVPSLIRMALALTEPLVHVADSDHRHLLFLTATHFHYARPFIRVSRHFSESLAAAKISPTFTLQSLRPTRIVKTYTDTGDPFRAKHEAKHTNLSQTMEYLRRREVAQFDETIIADTQGSLLAGDAGGRTPPALEANDAASLPSHTCLDPAHPEHAELENGLCMNLIWPLNDRHFVLPLEPRPVAFLLRDLAALKDAQRSTSSERFKTLYRPKMLLIEQQYLPQIDSELAAAAKALIPSLPPAVKLT
jgi:hypothetical protein